ncbi:MAG: UDP-N-acetylenolpyruvoylglucosamine reductase [candidate division Zixibacteria bacterium RBG-1]|nr:MAG: UDP-N-acetylenolpyruvoylglucosamine reductase [candidate division Zixibacteria bacterium RBG-1]
MIEKDQMSLLKTESKRTQTPEPFDILKQKLGQDLKEMVSLAPYTTFRIGGPADYFYQARTPEKLMEAVMSAKELNINYFLLAGGSNILINDQGFRGLIIRNGCDKIEVSGEKIVAQSGAVLQDVVDSAYENSLTGFEFATGIKGSLGGAVYGNAGAFGHAVGEILSGAVLFTAAGEIKVVDRGYFDFVYRGSKLKQSGEIVLSASFQLQKGNKEEIKKKMDEIMDLRNTKHPHEEGSAGSFFKNIKSADGSKVTPAGVLLEQVGAKELKIGDAAVFYKHANIVVNLGKAQASQVLTIVRTMREKVKERFNIQLEPEVLFLDQYGLEKV